MSQKNHRRPRPKRRRGTRPADRTVGADPCPHPAKRGYSTKKIAKRVLRKQGGIAGDDLHVYLCRCGRYHVGHRLPLNASPADWANLADSTPTREGARP